MATRSLPTQRRPGRSRRQPTSIQAAARSLPEPNSVNAQPDPQRGGFSWQERCWDVRRDLGMVHYGMEFTTNNVSMIHFSVAEVDADGEPGDPLPLDHPASVELFRLENSIYGSVSQVVATLVEHVKVAGEGNLVATGTDDSEEWEILTPQELRRRRRGDKDKAPTQVVRIWKPDPQRPSWPDSSLRSVLAECEDLIWLRRMIRGTILSRLNNGFMLIDESMSPSGASADDPDSEMSPLMRDMFAVMSSAIQNPEAAAAVMPYLLEASGVTKDKVQYLSLDRPFDEVAMRLRPDLATAIAAGIDLPAERLLGMGDASHWSVWFIDDSSYAQHLRPSVELVVTGLERELLRPAWQTANLDPNRYTVLIDASELTSRARKGEDAVVAYDRLELSGKAMRRELGFDPGDAPDPSEIRFRLKNGLVRGSVASRSAGADNVTTGPPPMPESITAAALSVVSGAGLAKVDRDTANRLMGVLEAAQDRLLADVTARVAREAEAAGLDASDDSLDGLAVAVAALGLEAAVLVPDDAYEATEDRVAAVLAEGQRAAHTEVSRLAADVGSTAPSFLDDVMTALAGAAAGSLLGGLVSWTRDRLSGNAGAERVGAMAEGAIPNVTVPSNLVVDAMTQAGGGPGVTPGSRGVANAATAEDWLIQVGLATSEWQWDWGYFGSPESPFDPHLNLNGLTFADWSDERLRNPAPWPRRDFFEPQDHRGCSCHAIRVLVPVPELIES